MMFFRYRHFLFLNSRTTTVQVYHMARITKKESALHIQVMDSTTGFGRV